MQKNEGTTASTERGALPGALSLTMGLLAVAGVTVIWLLSSTPLDLPGWLRILSGWMFPIGAVASTGFGVAALRRRSGRILGWLGIALAGASVVAFVVMIATLG